MRIHRAAAAAAIAAAVLAGGCKRRPRYASSCPRTVALTAPWDGYHLPIDGGRVCASDAGRVELEYLRGDRAGWERRFEDALLEAGFARARCTSQSCTYQRDGERAVVQVIPASRWVTVIVRK